MIQSFDIKDKIIIESFNLVIKSNVKKAGASENVIRSDNESSWIPILDLTLKFGLDFQIALLKYP